VSDYAIEIDGLVKTFGNFKAVDGVSFKVPLGKIWGLIGPNGAGKTTTFSIVAGYLRATEGRIRVLGHMPHEVELLKGQVGVLPQDAMLPLLDTVGEFLVYLAKLQGMSGSEAEKDSKRALEAVGGSEWWSLRCGKLSHGMAKRVGIAQAILGSPKLVLLDEPTAGLDPKVAYNLRQFIKELGGKCAVVVSSHNLVELEEVCDGAVIMDRGKLVQQGSITELTGAAEEFTVTLSAPKQSGGAGAYRGGVVPVDALRSLSCVKDLVWEPNDSGTGTLLIRFESNKYEAEEVIAEVLRLLLSNNARISGLTKGQRLEKKVMELTQ